MRKSIKKSPKKTITKSRRSSPRPSSKSKSAPLSYKPVIVTLAILGLLYFGYRTLFRPQSIDINQVTGGTGTVTLALTPANSTKAANTTRNLELAINAGNKHVSGVQVEITFDPAKCVTPTVTQGTFLTGTPLVPISVNNGKISFTFVAPLPAAGEVAGKSGSGTLATITTGPKSSACTLAFTGNTEVYVTESTTNALASASDATINLPGASVMPSPSQTPTPTPSVSPAPSSSTQPIPCPSSFSPLQCSTYREKVTARNSYVDKIKACMASSGKTALQCVTITPR